MTTADLETPEKSDCTLAIDLGTSGPKVALVSVQGEVLACEIEKTPVMLLPGGGAEQDTRDWWEAICTATRRLLTRPEVENRTIVGLCCTTQWSGTVAVDRQGHPLGNAIIWMDARGAPYVKRITSGPVRLEGFRHRQTVDLGSPDRRHTGVLRQRSHRPTFSFSSMKNRKSTLPPTNSWSPRTTSISN